MLCRRGLLWGRGAIAAVEPRLRRVLQSTSAAGRWLCAAVLRPPPRPAVRLEHRLESGLRRGGGLFLRSVNMHARRALEELRPRAALGAQRSERAVRSRLAPWRRATSDVPRFRAILVARAGPHLLC